MLRGEDNWKICVGVQAKSLIEIPKIILCIEKDDETIAAFELEEEDAVNLSMHILRTQVIKALWEENPWKVIGEKIKEGPEKEYL